MSEQVIMVEEEKDQELSDGMQKVEEQAQFIKEGAEEEDLQQQQQHTTKESMKRKRELLKEWQCSICNKRFARYSDFCRHVNIVHRKIKEAKCETCDKQFTRKSYLNRHLKNTKSHNRLVVDEFQFKSFIVEHSYNNQYIWTIGEELTTAREQPGSKDFTVNILTNGETIVGHVPREISRQFSALLVSGGNVTVKVIANAVSTITHGIRVPCTYIVNGKRTFVQDVKDNIANIF